MAEVTHDREIIDKMLEYAEQMMAARNHPETGRILWTGKRDPVWPNKAEDAKDAKSAGTENGDVIGHIAYAALLVLQDKSLDKGYHDRARTLVRELDRSTDEFILPWLVDDKTLKYHTPDSPGYGELGERNERARGKSIPWNQQMMLNNGFQRLAECHDVLGDDPERVKKYDPIVKTSCDQFLSEVVKYQVDGHDCYKWSYAVGDKTQHYMEDGGHAGYDLLVVRAYLSGRYGITKEQLLPFVNTVRYVMSKGDGKFAWRVDGKGNTRDYLGGTYLYLAELDPDVYPLIASACLKRSESNPATAARILWMKHRRATRNAHKQG
jgi:hypothetical protein